MSRSCIGPMALVICICGWAPSASAQAVSIPAPASGAQQSEVGRVREELDRLRREFDALRRAHEERLLALEQRLAQMAAGPSVPDTATSQNAGQLPAQPPAAPDVTAQQTPQPGKVFNPDISVNGNFIAAGGRNPFATLSPLQLSEVEAAFQAVVDPYARADFFVAIGDEGAEVEEGFITFTALPANLLLKVGKMRAQFGKMNTLHTHSLPTADRPLVTANLLGGDEGISDAGLSLSHLVRNPYLFLELTGEVYAGQSEVFQSDRRSHLSYVGRVRAYRDLSDAMNIDLGSSFAVGKSSVEMLPPILTALDEEPALGTGLNRRLFGVDATLRYRAPERAIYRRFNLRTELVWMRQDLPDGSLHKTFGGYGLAEYQFARRWYAGARIDRSGRAIEPGAIDTGAAAFLTFWPTEFSQIRGQFRRINFAEGVRGNEILLQFNFSMGAHAAHIF